MASSRSPISTGPYKTSISLGIPDALSRRPRQTSSRHFPRFRNPAKTLSILTHPSSCQVFPVNDKLFIGLSGLATDTYTLRESLRFRVNMYRMKEEREITPETFTHLVSSTLYEKR